MAGKSMSSQKGVTYTGVYVASEKKMAPKKEKKEANFATGRASGGKSESFLPGVSGKLGKRKLNNGVFASRDLILS